MIGVGVVRPAKSEVIQVARNTCRSLCPRNAQLLRPQPTHAPDAAASRRPGLSYAFTMVNVRPKRFKVPAGPFRLRRRYASGSNLKRAQKETVKLLCIVGIISALCQKYTVYSPSGRLASAWRVSASSASAHAKWYPIPVALGALVLVFFRYKKRMDSKEVHVDENGEEVVRLRGPWQVCTSSFLQPSFR